MAKDRTKKAAVPDATMAFTELASSDPEATRRFLEKIFGWSFESVKMLGGEYVSFAAPGGRGGIRPTQPKERPNSTNYVRVPDLDIALTKIKTAGAEVVLPRVDVPGMGSFFWFRIPGGPIMACWQDAPNLPQEK
ncbi:MAG: VOC family protein [Methanobacteriota archaeon]|nr:MAG: VOC family protein [Euryarchaeota archaeon]